ncbi:MAG TPA: MFS transporter [Oleiagrimonas sp.]|nr:MFS transporter [Oleiagrimonas sp.]
MGNSTVSSAGTTLHDWFLRDVEEPLAHAVGGTARLKVITLLACVLALDAADKATVGAVAAQLEQALHISNVEIGWLVTASTAVGAVVTLPFGALADRMPRNRLLVIAILVWSVMMAVGGAATSYWMLLLSRLALGAVVAAAAPSVMSLIGDFFRPGERGRILGYTLAGELVGVAFGFLISGNVAAVLSWRASFWVLAAVGFVLAGVIWKLLPEPARGGHGIVPIGTTDIPDSGNTDRERERDEPADYDYDTSEADIEQEVDAHDIDAHRSQVLRDGARDMSLWQAVRYVLSNRTYRTLILVSSLRYFYFTGVRTFAIVFMRHRFDLEQAVASSLSVGIGLGAIVGVLLAGRIGDALIARGRLNGRVLIGAVAYLLAAAAFLPGLLSGSLWVTGGLFFVAAAGIGGANPAVDSARLDIMYSGLWGRAEGVRATARFALEAIAPPLFGYVSSWFDHDNGNALAEAGAHSASSGGGLGQAFLIMLVALVAAGLLLLLRGSKTYLRDVATAVASERASSRRKHGARND